MKELKIEELSVKQKLGMVMTALVSHYQEYDFEAELEYTLELIRNHSLGAVWVTPQIKNLPEVMAKIKEAADYPILIITDAESGIGPNKIGHQNPIACTGNLDLAYMFGKVTAVNAQNMGYNVICNPILDMDKGSGSLRSLGSDKFRVAEFASAIAKGMHDGGVLTVGKHYPSACNVHNEFDTHMGDNYSIETIDDLLDYNLYPYKELMKQGLLDGVMSGHKRLVNIDPEFPGTLSEKVLRIIRDLGFDGFIITDALEMMAIKAKYGVIDSNGMAIAAGNDLSLPFGSTKAAYEAMCSCYEKGIITDKRLDEATAKVLAAQHKTLTPPKFTELTEADIAEFNKINTDSICARTDEGVSQSLTPDGKHYFVVMVENESILAENGKVTVDTFNSEWYNPLKISEELEKSFKNSTVRAIYQYPSRVQVFDVLNDSIGYDDVIFITFHQSRAYTGRNCLTSRIVSLINAMQSNDRVSTVVHFGNPYNLEELWHLPRIIMGADSPDSIQAALNVLKGEITAKGVPTYNVNFK